LIPKAAGQVGKCSVANISDSWFRRTKRDKFGGCPSFEQHAAAMDGQHFSGNCSHISTDEAMVKTIKR